MADGSTTLAFSTREADRVDVSQGIALPGGTPATSPTS